MTHKNEKAEVSHLKHARRQHYTGKLTVNTQTTGRNDSKPLAHWYGAHELNDWAQVSELSEHEVGFLREGVVKEERDEHAHILVVTRDYGYRIR